jgi:diacylglycerol kinase family enzyme
MSYPARDRRFLLVLNPRAGIGSAKYLRDMILAELGAFDIEVHEVSHGEDIRSVVKQGLSDGCTDILAAGGDGTVSGVAGALAGKSAILGILPTGTANMLARELGVPLSVTMAARVIKRGLDVIKMDAMAGKDRTSCTKW